MTTLKKLEKAFRALVDRLEKDHTLDWKDAENILEMLLD